MSKKYISNEPFTDPYTGQTYTENTVFEGKPSPRWKQKDIDDAVKTHILSEYSVSKQQETLKNKPIKKDKIQDGDPELEEVKKGVNDA